MVLYLQINCLVPIRIAPEWTTLADAQQQETLMLVLYGLCLGTILMALLSTLLNTRLQIDSLYGWYALYALIALFAIGSHSGLAHMLLWPVAGYWPGTAALFFLVLICITQLYFCRRILARATAQPDQGWLLRPLAIAGLLLNACFVLFPDAWQWWYFGFLGFFGLTVALCLGWCLRSARLGHRLAQAWLLASAPLYAVALWAVLDGVGLIAASAWAHVAALAAAALDAIVMGLVLQWFARKRHAQEERRRALATRDPLTGFVTAEVFKSRLQRAWKYHHAGGRDVALAYVQVMATSENALRAELMLSRSVRVLRAATRSNDIVGRLEGRLLAVILPDMSLGDDLAQRLARIIAQGLMPDASDPRAMVLQFRIAATSFKHFQGDAKRIDEDLRKLLAKPSGWGSKPIRYIDRLAEQAEMADAMDSDGLEDMWSKALAAQSIPTKPSRPAPLARNAGPNTPTTAPSPLR
jgi:GGDEF domain-containing protein